MLQSMTILAQYKNTYRTTWILLNMFMQTNSSANRNGTRILDAPHIINHPRAEIPPAKFNTPIPRFEEKWSLSELITPEAPKQKNPRCISQQIMKATMVYLLRSRNYALSRLYF